MNRTEPQGGATADPQDLGPVAWLLDELRKTLDVAARALRRQLREADTAALPGDSAPASSPSPAAASAAAPSPSPSPAPASASASVAPPAPASAPADAGHLAQARDALHQAAGALAMVEQQAPARVLQAMEAAVARLIAQPASRTEASVARIEQAGLAVIDYLQAVLAAQPVSPVALFPQYRDVQTVAGHTQSHPADLWAAPADRRSPAMPDGTAPVALGASTRARFDQGVLKLVKTGDAVAARDLQHVCAGLATTATAPDQQTLWGVAAGYFEALALGLMPADLYAKRIASRVLTHYVALARGDAAPSDKLTQELLFHCARAQPPDDAAAPTLAAVRAAHGLADTTAVDYEQRRFGRFDPAQRAQARKRIAAASEAWSALADGDVHRFKNLHEQFAHIDEAMARLHPGSAVLTQALQRAVQATAHMGVTPAAPLALEVANAVLYLEIACEHLDEDDAVLRARAERLATRLDDIVQGGDPQPAEPWLEQLHHRLHERQSLASVAEALRRSLADIEQTLDQFFRAPREKVVLGKAVALFTQMRGVLAVLGLQPAAQGVARMRDTVESYMATDLDDAGWRSASFERLGSSLGALGFLVDMLAYQGTQAGALFAWDDAQDIFCRLAPGSSPDAPVGEGPVAARHPQQAQPVSSPSPSPSPAAEADAEPEPEPRSEAASEPELGSEPTSASAPASESESEPEPEPEHEHEVGDAPAPVPARATAAAPEPAPAIGSPLDLDPARTNAFLHEADECSRELLMALGNGDFASPVPAPERAGTAARALAAQADSVGFAALAQLARGLERGLATAQARGTGDADQARVFQDAAEDIRRLLHQLAAGFVKEPLPSVLQALESLLAAAPAAPIPSEAPVPPQAAPASECTPGLEPEPGPEAEPELESESGSESGSETEANTQPESEPAPDAAPSAGHPPEAVTELADHPDADLFPVFDDEAHGLLPRLGSALQQWQAEPRDHAARAQALRLLHTLKGSARLAGAMRMGEQAHALESAVDALSGEAVTPTQITPLRTRCDALQVDLAQLRARYLQAVLDPAAGRVDTGTDAGTDADADRILSAPALGDAAFSPASKAAQSAGAAPRALAQQTVRVPSQLLDRLTSQTGEVLTIRARLESRLAPLREALGDLGDNLDRLRRQLRDVELQAESQMQSRLAQVRDAAQDFDPLEFDRFTRMQELTRMMAESVGDVAAVQRTLQSAIDGTEDDLAAQARQARELQHDLMRTRMVALDSAAERLQALVRQTARDTGREAQLHIEGGTLELDRGTLERLVPAFEHLLRNAVVHGIEDADARIAAGKPPVGAITLTLQHEAHDLAVRVADDGRGLDLPRIQAQALSLGLLPTGRLLSADEAADLIFLPGFSTARQVTALAGRGIGMDVVRAEVQALGGRIDTHSASGQGTAFRIVLPQATAVAQVVLLRAGEHRFGVPSNLVEAVRRVGADPLAEAYRSEQLVHPADHPGQGEALPFYWAGALLQSSGASLEAPGGHASVLILRSAEQRLALHVDEVLGQQEVVVKSPGPQLSRLAGLTGLSVLASGAVVLVYNPVALASVHGAQARQAQHDRALRSGDGSLVPQVATAAAPLVLVVDDSMTVRRVVQRLLQRDGWRVALANDGQQALELLQQEMPAVLLSDIEMPRLDGFALARHIRADERLRSLPIVMITSRTAEKHREHARALGVDHYLGKPYAEEELLSLVRRYAGNGNGNATATATATATANANAHAHANANANANANGNGNTPASHAR